MNEATEVFDWAMRASDHLHALARINELRHAIRQCGRECGDCSKWMCSSVCPREKPGTGQRAGYSVGSSMSDPVCHQYEEKASTSARRENLKDELAELIHQMEVTPPTP